MGASAYVVSVGIQVDLQVPQCLCIHDPIPMRLGIAYYWLYICAVRLLMMLMKYAMTSLSLVSLPCASMGQTAVCIMQAMWERIYKDVVQSLISRAIKESKVSKGSPPQATCCTRGRA